MIELHSPGVRVRLSSVGARILSCVVDGIETTFGPGAATDRLSGDTYAGSVCGRHAGRISNSQFPLDGKTVHLVPNTGPNQLHGGKRGFYSQRWDYMRDGSRVEFSLHSNDGDEGYPGDLDVTAKYELQGNVLSLAMEARTSKSTIVNLTNHAYWNMAGQGSVLDHELMIAGSRYFPLDELLLPLGEIRDVAGTRYDFRKSRPIGGDYDNCIRLDGPRGELKHALMLRDTKSGRNLNVWASEGCMQFYTAVHWNPEIIGQSGPLQRSMALAIEPQNVADAPNHLDFPSSTLRPGEIYKSQIEWRFS